MKFKTIFITIEKNLFNHLENTIASHNLHYSSDDNNKIMRDKVVYLLDQINYQKYIRKDDVSVNGFINIPSKYLNQPLKKELKKYREFLVQYNYIKIKSYSENTSYGYRVCYFENPKRTFKKEYLVYEFISKSYEKFLTHSIDKYAKIEYKKSVADRNTRHLTKWINQENIQVDWETAFKFIEGNEELTVQQKEQYSYSLNRIRFHQWYYLRSTNDNRLHSNLTNLPSRLRTFLSHKNQKLVSLDIKTSQPFILAGVFNLLLENRLDEIEVLRKGIRSKKVKDKFSTVMNSISLTSTVVADLLAYKNLVCTKDIYNHIAISLDTLFLETVKINGAKTSYVDNIYNSHLGYKTKRHFKELRGYCKFLVLEYMYCSIGNNSRRLKEVKKIYPPAVNKFIYDFKFCEEIKLKGGKVKKKKTIKQQEQIDRSKKLFSKFLQQLEAFIILDIISKELSKLYPKMFMATIHDSLVVPTSYENVVKQFLKMRLLELLGLKAKISTEYW
ncbi:hypothetical protein [Olleya sp. UBA1516]|uniref:hypothetical protein n=1 Tax=Olleya sp. UBA1516 TaxID=1947013 RepID=UPI0025DC6188|nr:hypothetical protein [Olleya sp. UBA1516]|tara:strand:- start:15313 stop:16815 length:1503 start_codon:yes stop_codon:yes gene_type:complete